MALSKKNLDKLNKYKNNKALNNDSNYKKIDNHDKSLENHIKSVDPNKIFYSVIDNSESLESTSKVNHLLRNSQINQDNTNSRKNNYFKKLTIEEELYDEFNYLLDE